MLGGGVFLSVALALVLLFTQIIAPKEVAKGDVDASNTDNVWAGTLGPAAVGSASSDIDLVSNVTITADPINPGVYKAGLSVGQTTGYIRAKVIDISPSIAALPGSSLKNWAELSLGIARPVGTTTSFTVDVLCGSSSTEGCILNQPLPLLSNVPLTDDQYTLPASLNSKTKIKIQVNFTRPDTVNPITTLYSWQVQWELNNGVSLAISKSSGNPTPNTANPQLLNGSSPGVNNYNQVAYQASYSLNRSVQNLKIEIPFPTGSYSPITGSTKTYGVTYVGSSGSNTCFNSSGGTVACTSANAVKTVFNLGDKDYPPANVGSVTVTFKINSGPPDDVIFRTRPKISGDDYPAQTLPDDVLNIESWAFAGSTIIAPEYIAANLDFYFIMEMGVASGLFQSDLFNASYVLDYSATTCFSNTIAPVPIGSGASLVSVDTSGRKVTFNFTSPMTNTTSNLRYGVRLRANGTCSAAAGIPTTFTISSEQNSTFVGSRITNATYNGGTYPKFDSSSIRRFDLGLDGPPSLVGAGQLIGYNLRLWQRTSFPTADFWALYKVPSNTTFVAANVAFGELQKLSAFTNNWRIYYSTSTSDPPSRSSGWTELTNGNPITGSKPPCAGPYGCIANPAPAQKITWIKWELGGTALNWDRQMNFDPPMGQVSLVTDNNASGTIVSKAYSYSGSTCSIHFDPAGNTACPITHTINVDNSPYFNVTQTPCLNEWATDQYSGCGSITAPSGGSYYTKVTVWNGHESGPITRGDATNVTVAVRLPDRQYLNPVTPIDLSAADTPHARCTTLVNLWDTNCPLASGVNQNPAPWLNPSAIKCSSATGPSCSVEWQIPIIYAVSKFPTTLPDTYTFHIRLNVRSGLIDQTKICENGIGPCNIDILASTPTESNTNLAKPITSTVKAGSNPNLTVQKELPTGYTSPITYGTGTHFRINYRNLTPSTGAVTSVTIIDRLPINDTVQPAARLNLDPAYLPNNPSAIPSPNNVGQTINYSVYYMLQNPSYPRTSATPPPKNDPGWTLFTGSFDNNLIPLIDWVKWERSTLFPVDNPGIDDGQDYVELGLRDVGSPDDTAFTNKAFLIWTTGAGDQSVEATAQVRIDTPGFATTSGGNVGSVGDLGVASLVNMSAICASVTTCNTNYLGIVGAGKTIGPNFKSFKDWLISEYTFASTGGGLKTDYAWMDKEYGKNAVACNSEDECLTGSEHVEKYTVTPGNVLKINTVGSYANATYTGTPKIVFVDAGAPGNNDALEINTNMKMGPASGIIFVVNGNVKVAYGVTDLDGVFLVEGQFSTGRRTQLVTNGQAGKFATISIGRDGFARIAYVSGDNVRFIKCLDLNCTGKEYGYVTTVVGSDVKTVSMALYETPFGATIDYPKIVVGMRNGNEATTKFISCYDKDTSNGYKDGETCLDNDTVIYPDANDPEIIVATDGIPSFTFGVGTNGDRAVAYADCRFWPAPSPDPNCPSPAIYPIDGGAGVNKGNETSYSYDRITGFFGSLVGTYVDRSAGKSDLWFTKLRYDNLGTTCSQATNWDCRRIVGSAGSPGNVSAYHTSITHAPNGITRVVYQDTVTHELKYLQCSDKPCTATQTKIVDCTSGCQAQSYVSAATSGVYNWVLYNAKIGTKNEVKLAWCLNPSYCHTGAFDPWTKTSISNVLGSYVSDNAEIYTQSLALGRVTEVNMPRLVFFDKQGDNNFLLYARCSDFGCTPASTHYEFIDDGTAVSLPDRQLNLKGSVIAYGIGLSASDEAINLQRDLFGEGVSRPGEIFTLEPKYYYIFRNIIKEPQKISETPP